MKLIKVHLNQLTYLLLVHISFSSLISCSENEEAVTPETALRSYLAKEDGAYSWELTGSMEYEGLTVHSLLLTSQQWREHTWKHTLTIIDPAVKDHNGALLFITHGKNENGNPVVRGRDEEFIQTLTTLALKNKAMVAIIWQIPNQPLYDDLTEDELISFTLHNFKLDGDYTWPLLFPMVKSAVKAMDAVQEFSEEELNHQINRFVVTGASKRGWTTWLTGSQDQRVQAICPMVIDVLNMPVNVEYQVEVWGDYSIQIQDYVNLNIPQTIQTDTGRMISTMIDPYSYRESLTMPKMIFIGTNDEYWPVDAIKNYLDDIPGENYIHYVPNAGHGLGDGQQALRALSAFLGRSLAGKGYPQCKWSVTSSGEHVILSVQASQDELLGVTLWTADSEDRDFRDATFVSTDLSRELSSQVEFSVDLPVSGYRAFNVDLIYSDPLGGEYSKSTRMFVANEEGIL
jgi:PhoPQ-activated pathogenicity-related protein